MMKPGETAESTYALVATSVAAVGVAALMTLKVPMLRLFNIGAVPWTLRLLVISADRSLMNVS